MSEMDQTRPVGLGKRAGEKAWKATKWFSRKTAKLLRDSILLARPLSKREQFKLSKVKVYLKPEEEARLAALLRQGRAEIRLKRFDWSFLVSGNNLLPRINFIKPEKRRFNPDLDVELKDKFWLEELDNKIRKTFFRMRFKEFSERAWSAIPQFIAPNLLGLGEVKQAAALQLLAPEPVHILLLGDPGTGKTDVLRSSGDLASTSSFGLGSGTSGVGLSVTVEGQKVLPGLLPMAHGGVCCIDELNLMKKEDYAAMYNAMEKGFVSYDKKGKHYRFDALIKLLSAANPVGDKFKSYNIEQIKKQLPFDSALLSRFHLIFFVKRASLHQFAEIAERIISDEKKEASTNDILFVKRYIKYASQIDVKLQDHFIAKVKEFVVNLKKEEDRLPFEITPRTVKGIIRLLKASARIELRDKVDTKDLERVFSIFNEATDIQ